VNRIGDLFTDAWAQANHFSDAYEHPQFGETLGVHGYAEFARTPGGFARRMPLLGEHGRDILAEIGMSDTRVLELLATGGMKTP
jgi:crotonobetainyl-CoA:carnitine CoA-transferase CaiB-like acyl-CoA transferase